MGCFQVRYDSRVVIYERKLFIRLATVHGSPVITTLLYTLYGHNIVLIGISNFATTLND